MRGSVEWKSNGVGNGPKRGAEEWIDQGVRGLRVAVQKAKLEIRRTCDLLNTQIRYASTSTFSPQSIISVVPELNICNQTVDCVRWKASDRSSGRRVSSGMRESESSVTAIRLGNKVSLGQ